jgi:hypothetical protein
MEMLGPLLGFGTPAVVMLIVAVTLYRIRKPRFTGAALFGIARIQSLASTGTVINNRYVCKIRLRVEIPGREPYEVTVRQAVHPISMASVQPGSIVRVQIDSDDLQKVRIDSAQPMRAAATGSTGSPGSASVATLAEAYNQHKRDHGSVAGRWASAAELLASGQRVPGLLRSFAATGNTLRGLGRTATATPELLDAPQYLIEAELRFPNLAPVIGRSVQSIPSDAVPCLAIGLELTCAVDAADPAHRFVVDWASVTS